jgi:hypothetical protein
VLLLGVHTPFKHTLPDAQSLSCVQLGVALCWHVPSRQIKPLGHCALVVQLPGFGVGVVSVGATHRPVLLPPSAPAPRQTQPAAQSALVWQVVAHPADVQTWLAPVHSQFPWQGDRLGGCAGRQPTPSQ